MATSVGRLDVRPIVDGEQAAWALAGAIPFLEPITGGDRDTVVARETRNLEIGRTWASVDGDRFVGTSCVYSRTVRLPGSAGHGGAAEVAMAAISGVGVSPTHRRRGLLGRMMTEMLEDARRRGEPVAGLLASESGIYGRFGFGVATYAARTALASPYARLSPPAPAAEVRLLSADEAADVLPGLFERAGARRPGTVGRSQADWADVFADHQADRGGDSARFFAVTASGYAIYRAKEVESAREHYARLMVRDLIDETAEGEAALWQFLLDVDLAREIEAFPRPLDDPIRHRLSDPRQLRTLGTTDWLWLRVLDMPGAFCARGYLRPGRLVLDVRPAASPAGADPVVGRWALDAAPDGATCRKASAGDPTDLTLGVAEVGSLLAGGVRASVLGAAGKIDEERPGALDAADALFASRPEPWCITSF